MAKIGDNEYNCHPALEADITMLQNRLMELIEAKRLLTGEVTEAQEFRHRADKRADELSCQVASLRVKLNKISTFDAYSSDEHQDYCYSMRVSRIQLARTKDAKEMVDYVIECFRHKFYELIIEQSGK